MIKPLSVLALLVATGLPLAACAQQGADAAGGPPPAVLQARADAKAAAFNDLSPATRAKVQAIIDSVNNGQQTDLRAASQQIDAALSPAESTAVLGERGKMMTAMHNAMPQRAMGAGPNGAPPNGAPGAHAGRKSTAGRFLLQLGVSPEKMRELRASMRGQGGQQQPH